jgi:hypothetical protein
MSDFWQLPNSFQKLPAGFGNRRDIEFPAESGLTHGCSRFAPLALRKRLNRHDLQDLVTRGWVKEESGKYQITPAGKKIREDVETETERLFFQPWSCLNESELEQLASLANQFLNGWKTKGENE